VDPFVKCRSEQLFETKGIPQENPKLEVPRIFLEATREGLQDCVRNLCAERVFDFHEIGITE
jgi:hypothetical protein